MHFSEIGKTCIFETTYSGGELKGKKGKRRGKLKINLVSPSRMPLNLHPRKELNENLSILVSSVMRITTLRTAQGGPKLVDY